MALLTSGDLPDVAAVAAVEKVYRAHHETVGNLTQFFSWAFRLNTLDRQLSNWLRTNRKKVALFRPALTQLQNENRKTASTDVFHSLDDKLQPVAQRIKENTPDSNGAGTSAPYKIALHCNTQAEKTVFLKERATALVDALTQYLDGKKPRHVKTAKALMALADLPENTDLFALMYLVEDILTTQTFHLFQEELQATGGRLHATLHEWFERTKELSTKESYEDFCQKTEKIRPRRTPGAPHLNDPTKMVTVSSSGKPIIYYAREKLALHACDSDGKINNVDDEQGMVKATHPKADEEANHKTNTGIVVNKLKKLLIEAPKRELTQILNNYLAYVTKSHAAFAKRLRAVAQIPDLPNSHLLAAVKQMLDAYFPSHQSKIKAFPLSSRLHKKVSAFLDEHADLNTSNIDISTHLEGFDGLLIIDSSGAAETQHFYRFESDIVLISKADLIPKDGKKVTPKAKKAPATSTSSQVTLQLAGGSAPTAEHLAQLQKMLAADSSARSPGGPTPPESMGTASDDEDNAAVISGKAAGKRPAARGMWQIVDAQQPDAVVEQAAAAAM